MLIRIADHFKNNPKRIDKLIAIKGLPEEWLYRDTPEGRELRKPWAADIDANIPDGIRNLCEPIYVNFRYSPVERGQKEIIDRRQILGLKIDYNTEPGREMWDQVERYIEETIPRNERIPVPVVCAKDERSAFETYRPRRTQNGSLEFITAPVPEVDLNRYKPQSEIVIPPAAVVIEKVRQEVAETVAVVEKESPQEFICSDCDRTFKSKHALNIHQSRPKNHAKVKETAGAK
jgi:hypothetical protein